MCVSLFLILDRLAVANEYERSRQVGAVGHDAVGVQRVQHALHGMAVFVALADRDGRKVGGDCLEERDGGRGI